MMIDFEYQDIQDFEGILEQDTYPDPESLCILNELFLKIEEELRYKLLHGKRAPWSKRVKQLRKEMGESI